MSTHLYRRCRDRLPALNKHCRSGFMDPVRRREGSLVIGEEQEMPEVDPITALTQAVKALRVEGMTTRA